MAIRAAFLRRVSLNPPPIMPTPNNISAQIPGSGTAVVKVPSSST